MCDIYVTESGHPAQDTCNKDDCPDKTQVPLHDRDIK